MAMAKSVRIGYPSDEKGAHTICANNLTSALNWGIQVELPFACIEHAHLHLAGRVQA